MRFRKGLRLAAVLGTAALLPLAASGAAAAAHSPARFFTGTKSMLTKAQVERLAARATHRSIIIFKNQLPGLPARGVTASARGTVPITMDVSWVFGDPDVLGVSSGNSSTANLAAPELAPRFFFGLPEATGPFGPGGVGNNAKVNLAAVANTNPFDQDVSASSGDVWAQSVNAKAPYTPLSLGPGQTGTITLTFTPTGPKGEVVHGFIGVDTLNLFTASGDELINIPYSYTVG